MPPFNFKQTPKKAWKNTFAAFVNTYIKQHYGNDPPVQLNLNESPDSIEPTKDGISLFRVMLKPDCEVVLHYRLAYVLGWDGHRYEHLTKTMEAPGLPHFVEEPPPDEWYIKVRCNPKISYSEKITLPEGFYLKPERIIEVLNDEVQKSKAKNDISFVFNALTRSVQIKLKEKEKGKGKESVKAIFNTSMGQLLGFGKEYILEKTENAPYPLDLDIGLFNIYVYTSLIASDEIVGNSLVPLLRCVPIRGEDGQTISELYNFPFYKPLIRNSFHEITITLRDDIGEPIPFSANGRVNVTLHFKKLE